MKLKETIERENSCRRGENRCKLSNTKRKGEEEQAQAKTTRKKKAREIFGPFGAVWDHSGGTIEAK